MPLTRRQAAEEKEVGICVTLDDTARQLTRASGRLHSIANLINDTIEARPGFFKKFRTSGENSSANARAIWRYHDRRWAEKKKRDEDDGGNNDEDNDEEEEEDDEPIDDEIDRRIGDRFSFTRAVEVGIEILETAKEALTTRKREMEACGDGDGADTLAAFVEAYERELKGWNVVKEHLNRCSTYLGESILDTSLRHGWL